MKRILTALMIGALVAVGAFAFAGAPAPKATGEFWFHHPATIYGDAYVWFNAHDGDSIGKVDKGEFYYSDDVGYYHFYVDQADVMSNTAVFSGDVDTSTHPAVPVGSTVEISVLDGGEPGIGVDELNGAVNSAVGAPYIDIFAGNIQVHAYGARGPFILFGTAEMAQDPTDWRNEVVKVDTSASLSYGGAWLSTLNVQVSDLTGKMSFDYYFDSRSCGGGSPRFSLRVDKDGNGTPDGNVFGYTFPLSGCASGTWTTENLTDGNARWDTSQLGLGLPYVDTWADVVSALSAYPSHNVMAGGLVDDSAWLPTAAGVAYYDNIELGDSVLRDHTDVHP